MSEERRDWWNLFLNPITGFRADSQESYFEAEKRYYQPLRDVNKQIPE